MRKWVQTYLCIAQASARATTNAHEIRVHIVLCIVLGINLAFLGALFKVVRVHMHHDSAPAPQ